MRGFPLVLIDASQASDSKSNDFESDAIRRVSAQRLVSKKRKLCRGETPIEVFDEVEITSFVLRLVCTDITTHSFLHR